MKNFKNKNIEAFQKDLNLNAPLVSQYMTPLKNLITIKANTPIMEAIRILLDNRITGAPVLNKEGEVIGLIDDKDCLNILFSGAYHNQPIKEELVSNYMTDNWRTISLDEDIVKAADVFLHERFKRLLVLTKNNKLAGQISRRDILIAIKDMDSQTW